MVEVTKKEKETSDGVIRRFNKQVQGSGKLPKARKKRFFGKKKTKRQTRQDAAYRAKVRKAVDKYKRMGIFDEDKLRDIKKRLDA